MNACRFPLTTDDDIDDLIKNIETFLQLHQLQKRFNPMPLLRTYARWLGREILMLQFKRRSREQQAKIDELAEIFQQHLTWCSVWNYVEPTAVNGVYGYLRMLMQTLIGFRFLSYLDDKASRYFMYVDRHLLSMFEIHQPEYFPSLYPYMGPHLSLKDGNNENDDENNDKEKNEGFFAKLFKKKDKKEEDPKEALERQRKAKLKKRDRDYVYQPEMPQFDPQILYKNNPYYNAYYNYNLPMNQEEPSEKSEDK